MPQKPYIANVSGWKRYKQQALRSDIKATVHHFWQSPAGMRGMTTTLWTRENKLGQHVTQAG